MTDILAWDTTELVFAFILFSFIGLSILFVIKYPKGMRKYRNTFNENGEQYVPRETKRNKPITKEVGKLVRKVIDKKELNRNTYMRHFRPFGKFNEPTDVPYDYYYRYYLTFETFKGYKSFTVNKKTFHRFQKGKYGYLQYQKSHFVDFEMRPRDALHIDEQINKNRKKGTQ